jgi:hypothetical protein
MATSGPVARTRFAGFPGPKCALCPGVQMDLVFGSISLVHGVGGSCSVRLPDLVVNVDSVAGSAPLEIQVRAELACSLVRSLLCFALS